MTTDGWAAGVEGAQSATARAAQMVTVNLMVVM